jgi:hypothetical protein
VTIAYDPNLGPPSAKILLLGTFHFRSFVEIRSSQRQREIEEVVERLAAFRTTQIAVEQRPERQDETDREYVSFRQGEFPLPADEVHQIGFRLAAQLGHERVRCVNAWDRYFEPPLDVEKLPQRTLPFWEIERYLVEEEDFHSWDDVDAYARQHGQEFRLGEWAPCFERFYEHRRSLLQQRTLREHLLDVNAEAEILKTHGRYLVERFKIGEGNAFPGPDLIAPWYARNLRIFANLQRITAVPDERILLVIGYDHLPILRHCVLASPEYQLADVESYLR